MNELLDEMTRPHFLGCDASYEEADTVIFGAPFDSTASFLPGTRFAPNALRADSLIGFEGLRSGGRLCPAGQSSGDVGYPRAPDG